MEILGYTIINSKELFQLKWDKGMLEAELKFRPTRDQMFKYGEEVAEGQREVLVLEMIEGKSKTSNNRMFTVTLQDVETKAEMLAWLVAEPKKRWMLKSLLSAIGIEAGQDGVYEWSVEDVIGKQAIAIVGHVQEPWINRDGVEVTSTKAKISEFIPSNNI